MKWLPVALIQNRANSKFSRMVIFSSYTWFILFLLLKNGRILLPFLNRHNFPTHCWNCACKYSILRMQNIHPWSPHEDLSNMTCCWSIEMFHPIRPCSTTTYWKKTSFFKVGVCFSSTQIYSNEQIHGMEDNLGPVNKYLWTDAIE